MRNLHLTFVCMYCRQKYGGDIAKFCGLLRISELYLQHPSYVTTALLGTNTKLVFHFYFRSHSDGVTCLQFNDFYIVSGSYDKTVKLWDFTVC